MQPVSLLNPFDLSYVADDCHVLAFFTGHPAYECVEAMFSRKPDGRYTARAILTKHDQAQIDHVNDAGLLRAAASLERTTVLRDIHIGISRSNSLPVVDVTFRSQADERVHLHLACGFPPSVAGGGLTDPGRHSLGSSLPIMHRGVSALASQQSRVEIDEQDYPIPEASGTGSPFVACRGFYTEQFDMAAIRSGVRELRVVQQPQELKPGALWIYETSSGIARYEMDSIAEDGRFKVVPDDSTRETVYGRAVTDGIRVSSVVLISDCRAGACATLGLTDDDRFEISINEHRAVVSGSVQRPGPDVMILRPDQPAWAVERSVYVHWRQSGDVWTVENRCGVMPAEVLRG